MKTFLTLLSTAAVLGLASCTQPQPSYTVVSTHFAKKGDDNEFSKTFILDSDLRGNGWVMRKGAELIFGVDGSVSLNCITYATDNLPLPNAVHVEFIQYGADGNVLFSVPGSDIGYPLHLRHPRRDYPVSTKFGYNKGYFKAITQSKLAARLLRESEGSVTYSSGKQ